MKCFLCGRDFNLEEVGTDIDKNPGLRVGNKIICINCLHSLNILLRQIEVSAKISKL